MSCKKVGLKNHVQFKMSKNCHLFARVEPLVFVIGVWPSNLYELHIATSDSSNRVRSLDDLSNALVGEAVLVLDPIIDGFHLTRVLMDGGSCLNLLYQDTVHKMGIDPSRIKPTKMTFKGVTGSVTLEVVFGSPDNFRSEELIFDIVLFRSGYHTLLG